MELREKVLELWLPHTAVVDVVGIDADAPLVAAPADHRRRWIHHGSSISHCMEATTPTRTWPAVAARRLGRDLLDLGFAGQAMLDQFVARAIRDEPADLISLKLGINVINADTMSGRTFPPAVDGFLDTIREGHPTTPIVVISPIVCPAVEDHPGPTILSPETGRLAVPELDQTGRDPLTLNRIRGILSSIVARRVATDPHLFYLDGRDLFDLPDVEAGRLPDDLHPDEEGYRLMGERFAVALPKIIA